uniref:Uncharacterized protein n=1 Tax=Panagrolaimus sp. PS1159 TaxID=55785 RepID=A0AC35GW41_9BILA
MRSNHSSRRSTPSNFERRRSAFNNSRSTKNTPTSSFKGKNNVIPNKQREDVGNEWIAMRRKELGNKRENLRISESTDSTPCSRSESLEIYSSPVKLNPLKRDELDLEEEDSQPFHLRGFYRRPENAINIIEESDSSQRTEPMEIDIIHSSPDSKSQQSHHSKFDKFIVETSSDSDATMIMETDNIQGDDDSDPIVSQKNAISEALQYLSYRPNDVVTRNKSTVSSNMFRSAVKRKKLAENSFVKKVKKEDDLLDIKDYDDDLVEETPSQSEVGEFEQPDDDDDGAFNEEKEENEEEHSEEGEEEEESENNESTINFDDLDEKFEVLYDFEDSSSSDDDDEDESEYEEEDKNEIKEMNDTDHDMASDFDEEEKCNNADIDFIKPNIPNTPLPELITANIISSETYDGLVYTELDNEIIIITPAKLRVKDKGTLTYEDGTGAKFIGPSFKNQKPRTFIACPQMAKEKLFFN